MLPQILAGSYKEDTTVFTTWLSKAAIACGYQTPKVSIQDKTAPENHENQGSATKLKGRGRKEAREAAKASKETVSNSSNIEPPPSVTKYEITTHELIKQVDTIAASKKAGIEVPESIVRVVQRAINARRRCAAWFQKTGVHDEDGSTARHVHFVGVLERALSVLLPSARANPSPPKPKEATSTMEEPSHQLANRFGALDIEDLDKSLDIAASEVVVATKKPADFRSIVVYELETSEIFYAESFKNGEDPEAKLASNESLRITPFDDFIYLPTARTLVKFRQYVKAGFAYPQAVQPFRFDYIFRPELLELPETKQKEKDHLFLSQILIDSSLNYIIRDNPGRQKPPVEDEFKNGLERLRKAGEISIWIVFASRIILDIHDLLGKYVGRGYDDLRSTKQAALKVLDLQVKGNKLVPSGNGECWHARDADLPASIYNFLNFWVVRAPLPSLKALSLQQLSGQLTGIDELRQDVGEQALREILARGFHSDDVLPEHSVIAEKMDLKPIKPDKDSNFLYANNPLYGGTLKFSLDLDMEKAGITLANYHLTIFAMAHLYNICPQTKIIQGEWPELDRIIQLHIGQFFAGQLPTSPSECHTRLPIRVGPTANASARNQRERAFKNISLMAGVTGKDMRHQPKLALSESSEILREYSSHKEPTEKSLLRLEAMIQARGTEKKKARRRSLTPLQFLSQVREWLPHVMTDTRTDYITMTRTCNKLLKHVGKRIHQRLSYLYTPVDNGTSSKDYGRLCMVAIIIHRASEAQFAQEHSIRKRDLKQQTQQSHLEVAGEVLQEYLVEHGESGVVDPDSNS